MANDTLATIYSWSLTSNNLISISLMKDLQQKFNKFFVFFNVVPGEKGSEGRTYNFKNSIVFKLAPYKLSEIHQVINAYVKGQGKMVGKYGIVNDSSRSEFGGSGIKSLYFNYNPADEEKNKGIPGIGIVSKSGDQTISVPIPAPTALAFAEMCKKIFDLAMEHDMKDYTSPEAVKQQRASETRGKSFEKKKKSHDDDDGFSSGPIASEDTSFDSPF